MQRLVSFLVLLVSILIYEPANSSPASPVLPEQLKPVAVQTSATTAKTPPEPEIALLREQLKVMRDYHSSLLDTVYWALGGIVTIAIILSTFGWWSNFKLYESDKRRMREDLKSEISKLEAKLEVIIGTSRSEFERTMDAKNEAHLTRFISETVDLRSKITDFEKKMDVKNEAHLTRLTSETVDVRSKLSSLAEQITAQAKNLGDTQNEIKKSFLEILKTVYLTNSQLRGVEEKIWEMKNIPSNILITQGQGLEAAVASEYPSEVKSVLTRMKRTIDNIITNNISIDSTTMDIVKTMVSKGSKANEIEVAEILTLLSKVKIIPLGK